MLHIALQVTLRDLSYPHSAGKGEFLQQSSVHEAAFLLTNLVVVCRIFEELANTGVAAIVVLMVVTNSVFRDLTRGIFGTLYFSSI